MGIFDFFKKKNKEEIAKESKIADKRRNNGYAGLFVQGKLECCKY